MSFDKDRWILDAINSGYIRVFENGVIERRKSVKFNENGRPLFGAGWKIVKFQTHKATGRVFYNMTWRPSPDAVETVTKSVLVNRVIALRFLPNPLGLPQVNHVDGVKAHNYLRQPTPELVARWGAFQLEWSSGRDNEKHAHRNGLKTGRGSQNANAKLTPAQVLEIRERGRHDPVDRLVLDFGVSRSTVVSILTRKTWSHI